jgi:hypothetical protein
MLAVTGITNKSLRALMTGLLGGTVYTMNQASYDLARLRVNGLITRIPGTNRYRLTADGLRFAIFYTKVHDRLLRPLLAANQRPAPPLLRKVLAHHRYSHHRRNPPCPTAAKGSLKTQDNSQRPRPSHPMPAIPRIPASVSHVHCTNAESMQPTLRICSQT